VSGPPSRRPAHDGVRSSEYHKAPCSNSVYTVSEAARVEHVDPMATHSRVVKRARRPKQDVATQDYATADPSNDTKPAFKIPRRKRPPLYPVFTSDASPSLSGTVLVPQSARQQQQEQYQQTVATQDDATIAPSYDLMPVSKSSRRSTCSSLSSKSWSAAGACASSRPAALQEFESGLGEQAFLKGLLSLRQNEMFQQENQALQDNVQRELNQTLDAEISRNTQLLRDAKVRHENQMRRERELERENQLLRESVVASTLRKKSAENAQRQVAPVDLSQALR
jgi:hypothetical protein